MAKKLNPKLAALSSAAILGIYGVGYTLSQPAATAMAAGLPAAPGTTTPGETASAISSAGSSASGSTRSFGSSSGTPAATNGSTTQGSALKDGSYTGTGNSRHGSVSVSVTVQGGRISTAPITSVTTRYSQNVIAGLPAQVVKAQGTSIDMVSGATDSSSAYVQAVQQALSKAGAASSGSVQVTGPQGVIYSNGGAVNG